MSSAIQSASIQVEGLNIHYLEAGEGDAALLVHGWPTSSFLWRRVLPLLAPSRRVVAPDLPAFGKSDKSLDVSYSFRFYARVIDGIVDQLGLEAVDLVVHDLGGPLALYWAVQHPEKIRSITFLNTVVFPDLSLAVKAFALATRLPGLRGLLSSPWGVGKAMRFGLANKAKLSDEDLRHYTDPFVPKAARVALLRSVYKLHPKGLTEIVAGLADLTCPVRLIYAKQDRILPTIAKDMQRLLHMFPKATLTAIPNAGHFLQEEVPEELSQLLLDFWQREVDSSGESGTASL